MRKSIPALLILAATLASAVVYSQLPDSMATHWNAAGDANGWSSRFWGAWLLPLIMAVMWPMMRLLPHVDPHRRNYEKFAGMYEALIIVMMAFLLVLHLLVLANALGFKVSMVRVMPAAVGILFIVIGSFLPKAHPNWFVGIRTPWTLTSDLSWERTHKLGGILFMIVGALTVVTALVAPTLAIWVMLSTGIGITVFLLAYSYFVWKQDVEKKQSAV